MHMKRTVRILLLLSMVVYMAVSCGYPCYTPTLKCNGKNDYWVEEGGSTFVYLARIEITCWRVLSNMALGYY